MLLCLDPGILSYINISISQDILIQITSDQQTLSDYRYNKRYIALKIAYLGWDFHGFASQENIDDTIEVQC